jgi:hypothetical protein
MSKLAKSFRLDTVAVEHLDELTRLTGSTQAAIVEQALAVYSSLLQGGLSGPRRMLASTLPPEAPQVASGAAQATLPPAREPAAPPSEAKSYRVKAKGQVYEFSFPLDELPAKGSLPCPCGSGEIFAKCHHADFKKAQKIGCTQRG